MNTLGIVQARVGSRRLPRKVLQMINGQPALYWIMRRVMSCRALDKVVVATSSLPENDAIAELAELNGWPLYRGSEDDVLSRFADLVRLEQPVCVARICADNMAIDPNVIERGIGRLQQAKLDVCSPFINNTYPFGVGAEVSTADTILRIEQQTGAGLPVSEKQRFREHIYFYAYEHPDEYTTGELEATEECRSPGINVSVDTELQFQQMKRLYNHFKGHELEFATADIVRDWDKISASDSVET